MQNKIERTGAQTLPAAHSLDGQREGSQDEVWMCAVPIRPWRKLGGLDGRLPDRESVGLGELPDLMTATQLTHEPVGAQRRPAAGWTYDPWRNGQDARERLIITANWLQPAA